MLENLTAEQDALCDTVAAEYINDLGYYREPDLDVIKAWLAVVYGLYGEAPPKRIEIADSPISAIALAKSLTGGRVTDTDWCGIADGGWVSEWDFYHRIGVISDEEFADTRKLRDFLRVAWDSCLLLGENGEESCGIIVRRPLELHLDSEGNLHSTVGPCLRWKDGVCEYAYHGIFVPDKMILAPLTYDKEAYLGITNTEQRRALSEINGWDWVARIVGASVIDTYTDEKTTLKYELCAHGSSGKLLRKQSPPLSDGSQPWYCEPVADALVTAKAARKWQAVHNWSVEQCEKDPDLDYLVET